MAALLYICIAKLELAALLQRIIIDSRRCQALKMLFAPTGIDCVNRLLS